MSEITITASPTMVNPDALKTVAELRQALDQANLANMEMSAHIHEMANVVKGQVALINSMIDAHEADDNVGIRYQLQRLSEHRASFDKSVKKPH